LLKLSGSFNNRVSTWESRIETYFSDAQDEDDYQIEKQKIAIASGEYMDLDR
jgi:cell division protein FtsW